MAAERLDKILSNNGYGTRRDVKKLLHTGIVCVNGSAVTDSSMHVNTETDSITVDGEAVSVQQFVYLMMNKCQNVVSASKDGEHGTVFDLLEDKYRTGKILAGLHTVGRLDIDTEGLLLLTTDGALTHRLISPKTHVSKTYLVFLRDEMTEAEKKKCIQIFANGIHIAPEDNDPEADCAPAEVKFLSAEDSLRLAGAEAAVPESSGSYALLTIFEGKYHQVKRMFLAVGNKVIYLKRTAIGNLALDDKLVPGQYRPLSATELACLMV